MDNINKIVYTETDTEVYTEAALREKIRENLDFEDDVARYLRDNFSYSEILKNLKDEFLLDLEENTIDEIISEDYYKTEIESLDV